MQTQFKQKVYLELVKCWSNQLNNKAMLKVQVVEFQEKYPWALTTPCNSSGWLTSVLHPLEQSVSTLKQSNQENCVFMHTLKKMLFKGNVFVINENSHSMWKQMGFQFNLATRLLSPPNQQPPTQTLLLLASREGRKQVDFRTD